MWSSMSQTLKLRNKNLFLFLSSLTFGIYRSNVKIRFNTSSSVTGMMLVILVYPSYTLTSFGLAPTMTTTTDVRWQECARSLGLCGKWVRSMGDSTKHLLVTRLNIDLVILWNFSLKKWNFIENEYFYFSEYKMNH